jgi:hypothetical protein
LDLIKELLWEGAANMGSLSLLPHFSQVNSASIFIMQYLALDRFPPIRVSKLKIETTSLCLAAS